MALLNPGKIYQIYDWIQNETYAANFGYTADAIAPGAVARYVAITASYYFQQNPGLYNPSFVPDRKIYLTGGSSGPVHQSIGIVARNSSAAYDISFSNYYQQGIVSQKSAIFLVAPLPSFDVQTFDPVNYVFSDLYRPPGPPKGESLWLPSDAPLGGRLTPSGYVPPLLPAAKTTADSTASSSDDTNQTADQQ